MHYRSLEDLNTTILLNLYKIPYDIDLIVGVPRSGLLAANLIALHLNVGLADVDSFVNGKLFKAGMRYRTIAKPFDECRNILVVDDSLYTGTSMLEVKEMLSTKFPDKNILYSAVFVVPDATPLLDIYFDICPFPRVFEWNLMHHSLLSQCCMDIDGVLCHDPLEIENDDAFNYETFLKTAKPIFKPTKKVGCLVTNRLEKYRSETIQWLQSMGIQYNHLRMLNLPSQTIRKQVNRYAEFKAVCYLESEALLFIESDIRQAQLIAALSNKQVYCSANRKMITPK